MIRWPDDRAPSQHQPLQFVLNKKGEKACLNVPYNDPIIGFNKQKTALQKKQLW